MARKLTPAQQKLTAMAMETAGIDLNKTPISNAWSKKGQKAELVQGLIEEMDGAEAAAMRMDAAMDGDGPPAAVVMMLNGEADVDSAEKHQLMLKWSNKYHAAWKKQAAEQEVARRQKEADELAAIRFRNAMVQTRGDEAAAHRRIAAEDAIEQQRIQQQQATAMQGGRF